MIVRLSEGVLLKDMENLHWAAMERYDVRLHLGLDCLYKHWRAFQRCIILCTAIQSLRVRIPAVRRENATVSIRPLVHIVFFEILIRPAAVDSI